MAQPAKRKNTDSVPLSDLIGDDGELRHDVDTFGEKPKRKTDTLTQWKNDERDSARGLTDTQIFLKRLGIILAGAVGIAVTISLVIFIVNDVVPAVFSLFLKSLPYIIAVFFCWRFCLFNT